MIPKTISHVLAIVFALLVAATVGAAQSAVPSEPSAQNKEARLHEVLGRPEPTAKAIPFAGTEVPATPGIGTVAKGLAFCLGLFLIGVFLVKRSKGGQMTNSRRMLKIVDRLPLSPKCSVYVVMCEDQKLVMAVGSDHVTVLRDDQFLLKAVDVAEPAKQ